jgi:hypothetical protein
MKLLQTCYTSCRIGQTGSSGFQFYSYSEGLTETERDEIGKLGGYSAPYGSNPFPTEDEVLHVLPVAFKYFRLSSGRVGVLQSTACMQEYTGRPGNFFTHALILDRGEFPFLPIWMCHSDYFKHDLSEEEKNIQSVPPLLPILDIDESSFPASFPIQKKSSIRQFANQGNHRELLSKLLDIILSGKAEKKPVIMADKNPEEVIVALCRALPFENVLNLTFSTYSLNPEKQGVLLSASHYEGSDFNFDDPSKKFDYYVFNRVNTKYPELEEQSEFSITLAEQLASEPERIDELYAFMKHFNVTKDIQSIDLIASIFDMRNFASKWEQILPFVTDNAKSEYRETFLNKYQEQIIHLIDVMQDEDSICKYLGSLLKLIHRLPDTSIWFNEIFSLYLSIMIKRLDTAATGHFIELNKRVLAIFKDNDREVFKKHFISDDTFRRFVSSAHTELACMNAFVLIISSIKILSGTNTIANIFTIESIVKLIHNIDEDQISADSFHSLISEASDGADLVLSGISEVGANSLAKRLVRELMDKKNYAFFHEIVQKGTFDKSAIVHDIREEAVRLLEAKALTQIPTGKDLMIYAQFGKWIDTDENQAIGLIMMKKNVPDMIEQMAVFRDTKKLSVFLEWKSNEIFPRLKHPEDWKKFYSLSKHLSCDFLNECVKKYFVQANDSEPLIALILFSHDSGNIDGLLRQIMALMKRATYSTLKQEIKKEKEDINEYFTSLNKGVQLKRLFNLKF